MSIFGGQTGKHTVASLTQDGSIAGVYPSEDQLWLYGPTINAPDDQMVAGPAELYGGSAYPDQANVYGGPVSGPPAPGSAADALAEDQHIDQQLNGQTPNGGYGEEWVNPSVGGPTGYGNFNEQPFYSGHSQIVQSNPAAEQGWGVGPARRWAHYPYSVLDNPTRNMGKHLRMGQYPWVDEESSVAARAGLAWEMQWEPYKQRLPVNPVVPVAATVPFVQTVPTYGGGQVEYQGLDVPLQDTGSGIY